MSVSEEPKDKGGEIKGLLFILFILWIAGSIFNIPLLSPMADKVTETFIEPIIEGGKEFIDSWKEGWKEGIKEQTTSPQPPLTSEAAPEGFQYSPPKFPNELQAAADDYQWRLDLVQEQTTRLDMYYAVKSGEFMSCKEFSAWLDDLRAMTNEFVKRNLDASYSGVNYAELLNANVNNLDYDWYLREHNRIKKNNQIIKSDIEIAIDNFDSNVEIYNQKCAT